MSPDNPLTPPAAPTPLTTLTVFFGFQRVAQGSKAEVIEQLRRRDDPGPYLAFDDQTGEQLDLDPRELHARPAPNIATTPNHGAAPAHRDDAPRGVGRPKLGVVAREVTLLPRHWDWLGRQPGGASVALRKLVDDARHVHADRDTVRAAREATYRFMTAIAGNLPGFEEATRALFAGEAPRFQTLIEPWPADLRAHLQKLSAAGWNTPQ
ncbi:DUF2239 family protein [Variovorax sp. RCC_210]|uniref:DUF2239 family protein n=1 Tax=Variovorax sp. RCC_210 TaxID=3239217 RepID=UPI003525C48F